MTSIDHPTPAAMRRQLLKSGVSASLLIPLLGTGLLNPARLLAAEWQQTAFTANNIGDALKAWGAGNAAETPDIQIITPEIAENGAKVEIEITCNLPEARTLAVFADKNPMPLCASMDFSPPALPYVKIQLKMAETTRIRAVSRSSDGRTHVAFREIKVTLGGCGGA